MQIDHVEFNVFKNQNGGCASVQWPCPARAGVQAVAKFLYAKVIRSALIRGKLKAGELPPLQDGDEALANFEPQALKVDGAPAPEQMFSPLRTRTDRPTTRHDPGNARSNDDAGEAQITKGVPI